MVVNRELSEEMARRVKAKPKNCYFNAFNVLLDCPEMENAFYVEGHAIPVEVRMPFDHGWIERDGEIIDPTLTAYVANKPMRHMDRGVARGVRELELAEYASGRTLHLYAPATRYTPVEPARAVSKVKHLPLWLWHTGKEDWHAVDPAWRESEVEAHRLWLAYHDNSSGTAGSSSGSPEL